MDEIEARSQAHLGMIEQVYSIKIKNKDEVARFIAEKADSQTATAHPAAELRGMQGAVADKPESTLCGLSL